MTDWQAIAEAKAMEVLVEFSWPSRWIEQPDGTLLPVLPSVESVNAARRILGYDWRR